MSFQDRLKKYREVAGYKQAKDFAKAADIKYSTYATYENGSWPNEKNLIKIAAALHVSIDELLGYAEGATDWIEAKLKPALRGTAIKFEGIQPDGTITLKYEHEETPWHYTMKELQEYYGMAEREAEKEKEKRLSEIFYKTLLELSFLQ